eukprot:1152571-Pelagomonas_calceolata.AAC.2
MLSSQQSQPQNWTYRFLLRKHGRGPEQEVDFVFIDQGLDQRIVLFALTVIIIPVCSEEQSQLSPCLHALLWQRTPSGKRLNNGYGMPCHELLVKIPVLLKRQSWMSVACQAGSSFPSPQESRKDVLIPWLKKATMPARPTASEHMQEGAKPESESVQPTLCEKLVNKLQLPDPVSFTWLAMYANV